MDAPVNPWSALERGAVAADMMDLDEMEAEDSVEEDLELDREDEAAAAKVIWGGLSLCWQGCVLLVPGRKYSAIIAGSTREYACGVSAASCSGGHDGLEEWRRQRCLSRRLHSWTGGGGYGKGACGLTQMFTIAGEWGSSEMGGRGEL